MQITGQQAIAAPPRVVWDALNDPQVLQRCLPGCERVERTAPDVFDVVIRTSIGPMRARFSGTLTIADAQPPERCTIVFEGQGGAVGFGKGRSTVTLSADDAGTTLAYTAQAEVGGKLAQVGSRLLDGVARRMSDDFFAALCKQLAGEPDTRATAPESPAPAADDRAAAPASTAVPATAVGSDPWMVPGWWLAVAAAVGSLATLAGGVVLGGLR